MPLSVTTDYATSKGNPGPYLKRIADAGFSHIHWCHQWNTDFLYSRWEIDQIASWLAEYDLQLLDLHASVGPEKSWSSAVEYERKSGVELVANRIDMAARLDCEVIIMHTPGEPDDPAAKETYLDPLRLSLDELEPIAREKRARIAVENGDFRTLCRLFDAYPPDYLGLCYDSGHGNMIPDGLDHLDSLKDRLISVHLHDNDGEGDQHNLLFTGTVDWPRLAAIMASSGYKKCVSMEVVMRNADTDSEEEFLKRAYATGTELSGMVAGHKK
ncbi:MAG: sugar phosphate isomerase/epimerase [Gemmatimonadetes bacterium]|jgi:sugar phosphate isomerase/epimerase|nr:sugar phosphate isomerase/epimerase [Gemmatimonadota bacterium]